MKKRVVWVILCLIIIFSTLQIIVVVKNPLFFQRITGGASIVGSFAIFIEGSLATLNISSPLNTTYSFSIGANYSIDLNVTSTGIIPQTWWYSLFDLQHNTYNKQNVIFTPNISFAAVRWQNRIEVFTNDSSGRIYNNNVTFFISVPNSAPAVNNLAGQHYACEGTSFSAYFNASDIDEDVLTVGITPNIPFFVSPTRTNGGVMNTSIQIFTGTLGKSNVGNHSETVDVSDAQYTDSKLTNISVIEINNFPTIDNIGVQTVWTQGENSTFYKEVVISDIESGNRTSGNFTFNLTFLSGIGFFNISVIGIMNVSPNATHVGVYNLSVCATDRALQNIHPNISLCGQTGSNLTSCVNFSLTVTNQNRAPEILNFYPNSSNFTAAGTNNLYFNATVKDADGTITDDYWYIDDAFIERDSSSLTPSFSYNFGCGVSGVKRVKLDVTDGLLNATQQWNITITNVVCPSGAAGGAAGGGGGGVGAGITACEPLWGCTDWDSCQSLNTDSNKSSESGTGIGESSSISISVTKIINDVSAFINKGCLVFGFSAEVCGYQPRACVDVKNCTSNVINKTKPSEVQACYYTPVPTCIDKIKNCHDGKCEVLVDCGGPCVSCATCSDGIKNQGEDQIDCGGPCIKRCPITKIVSNKSFQYILIVILLSIAIMLLILLWRRKQKQKNIIEKLRKSVEEAEFI
ncbi:hypothetical protein HYW75_04965 [Candidatus Pacearchaeota archaeon]|nr:hypothetical protein [Candidatus Pacearchaeota archaeon]